MLLGRWRGQLQRIFCSIATLVRFSNGFHFSEEMDSKKLSKDENAKEYSIMSNFFTFQNVKLRKVYDRSDSTSGYKEGVTRMKLGKYIFLYGNGPLDLTTSDNCNLEIIGDVLVDFGYNICNFQNIGTVLAFSTA